MLGIALLFVLCAPVEIVDAVAPPEIHAGNPELEAYLLEAAENSPALQMRYAEWRASLARIPQAKSLDNPQFTYTQFVQSDEARFRAGIMQMFPWFGTRALRGELAAAEADAALARLYEERNRVLGEVKEAYFEYAFLGESIEKTKAEADLLSDMEDIVSTRYSLGLAEEADLLRVQIEQSEFEDMYSQFLQQRPVFSQRLRTAIGREASEELPWPQEIALPPPPPPAPVLLARLRSKSPALQESDAMIEARQRDIALSRKERFPEITVGVEFQDTKQPDEMGPEWPYMFGVEAIRGALAGDGDMIREAANEALNSALADKWAPDEDDMSDEVMVTLGFSLPIWRGRIRGMVEESKQMEQSALAEKRDRTLELDLDTRMALFEIEDGIRRHALYKDVLIPRTRQTYDSLHGRYASGDMTAGFLDLLGTVQSLLNYELEQIRAVRDIQIGTARLERAVGGTW